MAEAGRGAGEGTSKALAIGYLVWQSTSSLIQLAMLLVSSLAYAGVISVHGELASSVLLIGFEVPVFALLAVAWAVVCLTTVAGVLFGVEALLCPRRPALLPRAIRLGRAMFAVCVASIVISVARGSSVDVLASIISAGLTGILALDVRRLEARFLAMGESGLPTPAKSFVASSVHEGSSREESFSGHGREVYRLCNGYATIMLIWGTLRVLTGLSLVFSNHAVGEGLLVAVAVGLVVMACGIYLIVVGRFGKLALLGAAQASTFVALCMVGFAIGIALLAAWGLWFVQGWNPAPSDLFVALLDTSLYGTGLFYARKFERVA